MLTHYPYENLGHADHGWLNARHHFSFASYYDPNKMGFGSLKVINDDIIKAGRGFDTHPHQNMEIITYVRNGAITHRDSKGNIGRTEAGDVQVMSAGKGVSHSEYNMESEDTRIYQIWIEPNKLNVEPLWDSHEFPKVASQDELTLLVSGDGKAPLSIHQDAEIYAAKLSKGTNLTHQVNRQAYLLVSSGELTVDDIQLNEGDGLAIENVSEINIITASDAEILLIDVPLNYED